MYEKICLSIDKTANGAPSKGIARTLADLFDAKLCGLVTDQAALDARRVDRLATALPEGTWNAGETHESTSDSEITMASAFEVTDIGDATLSSTIEAVTQQSGDLVVLDAVGRGESAADGVGPRCTRLLRALHVDTLVVKDLGEAGAEQSDSILVCIDGSHQCYAGLLTAISLSKQTGRSLEAVAVYDPYLHYTLFNGIVGVLTEQASRVFKFKDQEKLHEEIIDTGLAKIYQAHLEVARQVAKEEGVDLKITLLDGKAFQKVLAYANQTRPWLLVMGRIGVHSEAGMDMGATTENILRTAPCNILVVSRTHVPAVDITAHASIEWTPDAETKMERVPSFVRGVATTAILRWALERGHSIITPSVINSAMGDILPPDAAQAMGYVAEELAIDKDRLAEGITFICPDCGHAVRDVRPALCIVCRIDGADFEQIDRAALEAIGKLNQGALEEEETFDGKRLIWTSAAKQILRRVPSGYNRRRSKARIEKTARVRGIKTIDRDFTVEMVEQEMADTAYLTPRGETLTIDVKKDEKPDDSVFRDREESELPWTDAAWKRICRVPLGFMRDMTRDKVEEFAAAKSLTQVNLNLCEEGIAEGRRMMAEMVGSYGAGGATKQAVRDTATHSSKDNGSSDETKPAEAKPDWSPEAETKLDEATERMADVGKFSEERADQLGRGVAEERARENKMQQIGVSFMSKLGKQLGYGHPLSQKTAEHQFTWTAEAEDRLKEVPDFCREMTRWRVEWTAVKKDLGRVITPEIMDVKFDMWGEVSDEMQERDGKQIEWAPEAMGRLERIPEFVRGQVIQSVEGNAHRWGYETVDNDVLDKVIEKWIETGDFHEGKYGYQ
jgi:nucleotide-binding universal stress UspA family protein